VEGSDEIISVPNPIPARSGGSSKYDRWKGLHPEVDPALLALNAARSDDFFLWLADRDGWHDIPKINYIPDAQKRLQESIDPVLKILVRRGILGELEAKKVKALDDEIGTGKVDDRIFEEHFQIAVEKQNKFTIDDLFEFLPVITGVLVAVVFGFLILMGIVNAIFGTNFGPDFDSSERDAYCEKYLENYPSRTLEDCKDSLKEIWESSR
jgi:hypothetical protein